MWTHSIQYAQILFSLSEGLDVDGIELLLDEFAEILVCYLLTSVGGDHSFVGEALSYFFDPIVESWNKCVFELEAREQRLLQFEIELYELDESDLKYLVGG